MRARHPGLTRARLEQAVKSGALRVVPAVRGCIYLVPEADVPLVMSLAADLSRPRTERDLQKVGVEWAEVEGLAAQVLEALQDCALTTHALRRALPDEAVRSLGEVGKKVGLSSPLPVALRELEFRGAIERTPIDHRLDTESYEWRIPEVAAAERHPPPADRSDRIRAIVERFLGFFGPVSVKEISTWVGIPQRDAKTALTDLDTVRVAVEDHAPEALLLAPDRPALEAAVPASQTFTFLPFEDNLLTVHGGPGPFTPPAYHGFGVERWGSTKQAPLGETKHLGRRPLFRGEELVGFWDYDPDADEIVTGTFEPLAPKDRDRLQGACTDLGEFIRNELGHARSFSLDTEDGLRRRSAAIRAMA